MDQQLKHIKDEQTEMKSFYFASSNRNVFNETNTNEFKPAEPEMNAHSCEKTLQHLNKISTSVKNASGRNLKNKENRKITQS